MIDLFTLAIVVATLLLMLIRPRGVAEAWTAASGALVMLVAGVVPVTRVPHLIGETGDVLLFLAGMMVLTGIAERAQLFALLAERCTRLARGRGRLLFVSLYLLGAAVTATLSLDVTIIMLTPIIHTLTTRRRIDALPYLFACTFVANIASLILPVSNLTNLLVYAQLGMGFGDFVATMWLPNIVATLTCLLLLLWIFRRRIPIRVAADAGDAVVVDCWLLVNGAIVGGTLLALFAIGLANAPLWWASIGGGAALLVLAALGGHVTPRHVVHDLSPNIFVFVVAMTVIVEGFQRHWLAGRDVPLPHHVAGATVVGLLSGAIGSNIVNNVPMTVLMLPVIDRAAPAARDALAFGTLIGANIGPAFTTYGSLATMLWLTQVRRRGIAVSTWEYMRVSLIVVPVTLLTAGLALLAVLAI